MVLNADMFDKSGNKVPNNYTVQGLTGDKIYKCPIGWTRYDLSVLNKYNRENNIWLRMTGTRPGEQCVTFYSISIECVKSILINNFKARAGQEYSSDDDINHPGQKFCDGVYVTPEIKMIKCYSTPINGYKCVFMCRVNPTHLRIPIRNINSWLVSGNRNDIRGLIDN